MSTTTDIAELITKIQTGKLSRNKHYFALTDRQVFKKYKRAKLLISIMKDIERVTKSSTYSLKLTSNGNQIEICLTNPKLNYTRRSFLTKEELELINHQTNGKYEIMD